MDALHQIAWLFILIAVICALIIVLDLSLRPVQPLWIMYLVWPLAALSGGPLILVWYCQLGRSQEPLPKASPVLSTLRSGAGCATGDLLALVLLPFIPLTVAGSSLWGECALALICAGMMAILVRYQVIRTSGAVGPWRALALALQSDTLPLIAWQAGVYGGMAVAIFLIFKHPLLINDPVYWWMLQLAMAIGFCVAYPVNWVLLQTGIKKEMA